MANGLKTPGYPFVIAVWEDAKVVQDETKIEDISHSPTTRFYTSGWLVKATDIGVWIAAEWAPEDHTWRGITSIPKNWLVELVYVTLAKKAKKKVKAAVGVEPTAAISAIREDGTN
jgi:hypothetical protein